MDSGGDITCSGHLDLLVFIQRCKNGKPVGSTSAGFTFLDRNVYHGLYFWLLAEGMAVETAHKCRFARKIVQRTGILCVDGGVFGQYVNSKSRRSSTLWGAEEN